MVDLASADVAPVRADEQMDWSALSRWLRSEIPDLAGDMKVAQFHGGHANLTYCLTLGDRELVVRRPPLGEIAPGAHDMAREYRVLRGLAPHFDQAPKAYAYCEDVSVIGAPFIVMERCTGVIIRDSLPTEFAASPTLARDVSFALVDALVALQSVDVDQVGFGNRGRAASFVERQLDGWHKRWSLASDGIPDAAFERAYEMLCASRPETTRICVVHNDLKLDNCLFDPRNPCRVGVILDWDMTTIGDPLVEFGTLLGYWKEAGDGFERAPTIGLDMAAFPSRAQMIERYQTMGGQIDNLAWYEAFALWKHAVVLKQLHLRFARGESQDERFAEFPDYIPGLIEGAQVLLR
ncbi:MAG: phosphotransferase family protein [Henriciella sp.]